MVREPWERAEVRYAELEAALSSPEAAEDAARLARWAKERAELEPLVSRLRERRRRTQEAAEAQSLLSDADPEVRAMAAAELPRLEARLAALDEEIRRLLLPKDPDAEKNALVEIRAGTGGEEAALFAGDLFRMYVRSAERDGFKVELMASHPTERGGFKEVVFALTGKGAYGRYRFEGGVHRVQRVPETEAQGRIHTSAATVAVLPEADPVEVKLSEKDLRVDTFCSSGAGGQSVNTTYSAVRITHLPTGIVVQCQDERSQAQNRLKALRVLASRLKERVGREAREKEAEARRSLVGSGDRSEKIRTYNFPQNRLTDHRIGLTLHKLDRVMNGELGEVLDALARAHEEERLKKLKDSKH